MKTKVTVRNKTKDKVTKDENKIIKVGKQMELKFEKTIKKNDLRSNK